MDAPFTADINHVDPNVQLFYPDMEYYEWYFSSIILYYFEIDLRLHNGSVNNGIDESLQKIKATMNELGPFAGGFKFIDF